MLVDQVKATTEATKSIEGKISHEYWTTQRRSELTREVIIDAVEMLANAEVVLKEGIVAMKTWKEGKMPRAENPVGDCIEFVHAFGRLRLKIALVAGSAVIVRFTELKEAYLAAALCLNVNAFDERKTQESFNLFSAVMTQFLGAVRDELAIPLVLDETAIKHLSSGS